MIIVEGADATGKSTLILQLANEFNLPIIKSYKPRSRTDIYQFNNWANAAPVTPICDRNPAISDLIYGPIIRGATPSSLAIAESIRRNNFLVHCNPGKPRALANLNNQEQMDGVEKHYETIFDVYENVMEALEPNFIYDWTNPRSYSALVTHLTHFLERNR